LITLFYPSFSLELAFLSFSEIVALIASSTLLESILIFVPLLLPFFFFLLAGWLLVTF